MNEKLIGAGPLLSSVSAKKSQPGKFPLSGMIILRVHQYPIRVIRTGCWSYLNRNPYVIFFTENPTLCLEQTRTTQVDITLLEKSIAVATSFFMSWERWKIYFMLVFSFLCTQDKANCRTNRKHLFLFSRKGINKLSNYMSLCPSQVSTPVFSEYF